MSFLVALWTLSLVALIGIVLYAHRKRDAFTPSPHVADGNFGDLVVEELRETGEMLWRRAVLLRPHGERIVVESGILLKKGHNMLIEKAFGRVATEKGGSSSFFLKRIAEYKESLGEKDREKM
ncbi:MAG: hypothetical protein A3C93_00405 [Candidatus Lloydbacteria bacterium RIFCSPHIGHO2_02_FULL_54_17]|uniref:Uncharacterized protein n=1 Tax=Candidatus Lloydbacteria bacterium RIFCSPHIGHO2_02_FULL_54_17 TaxID=1798664 RepID=A0A1G2DG61_9BACT|nr:MAG: hypothetical protein A2762_01895 [Candidatus Lloydbacteria bacterium RIFCSPHIGHO2_01_FULL_54_11]OGZ11850.1 MAG: hypothetical protein A3C93_00405 [Candidatus Lloydbacteria bacterium RIFCSPHIGHO2_02_FULL_54_17]OGZ14129.1 MAG: hypothetical protein A2948_03380 [Candidatus Lloydbacteria bacterium RIFCSPLOWO2_01_FULL_54_18]OGZ16694.1 MAG: hypothetical protein A3H76_00110 [Candidatus Lloydbacteria bacterium RIFCSPLOWO2_02_FULL_54_12]